MAFSTTENLISGIFFKNSLYVVYAQNCLKFHFFSTNNDIFDHGKSDFRYFLQKFFFSLFMLKIVWNFTFFPKNDIFDHGKSDFRYFLQKFFFRGLHSKLSEISLFATKNDIFDHEKSIEFSKTKLVSTRRILHTSTLSEQKCAGMEEKSCKLCKSRKKYFAPLFSLSYAKLK